MNSASVVNTIITTIAYYYYARLTARHIVARLSRMSRIMIVARVVVQDDINHRLQ